LDIGIIGIADDEVIPEDLEALHLYAETSGLFCAPDHPVSGVTDAAEVQRILQRSDISAYSFLRNPMGAELDLDLMGENAEVAQDNIESTVYHTLAGTHVGLIPLHFAQIWVKTGALVPVAGDAHQVQSQFHAVRVKGDRQSKSCELVWQGLVQTAIARTRRLT